MNYRLELAFLIPDTQKDELTIEMVKATVAQAIEGINEDVLTNLTDNAVRFNSLDDLTAFSKRLNKLKSKWNAEQEAKQ